MVRVFLALAFLGSLGLAEQARLELMGKARLERPDQTVQTYTRSGGPALVLNLEAGDRLCITAGKGRLLYGVRAFALEARGAACFEVARPKSFWQNLVASCQDIGVCKKQAEVAFIKEAKSRGTEGSVPVLYVPTDYSLETLYLVVAAGQSLRVLDSQQELAQIEVGREGFAVSSTLLRRATRIEAVNRSGVVVYAAPVRWVHFASEVTVENPLEAALALWLTGQIGYAPAAYSYLLAAGSTELARILEAQMRQEFRGTYR
ncbi:hypothetical protein [Meiothermus hypogaeus]|uniref:Uncharacterized protein n=2 Tax=Meiothermus hypogaeus TaxID=884155 RepID=A0A511R436_9DEIN|nr:hypothetical protein [Meiothermus hypogaeus]RIH78234.1 hypothetical protein Mhypo_01628 [Meiothermus hypogaeus]GEM84368.1 hypothetical protein MHY01S_25340 [Meiothermus hypogaeus NBRC 106114]